MFKKEEEEEDEDEEELKGEKTKKDWEKRERVRQI